VLEPGNGDVLPDVPEMPPAGLDVDPGTVDREPPGCCATAAPVEQSNKRTVALKKRIAPP
jgi:hypothetical protein